MIWSVHAVCKSKFSIIFLQKFLRFLDVFVYQLNYYLLLFVSVFPFLLVKLFQFQNVNKLTRAERTIHASIFFCVFKQIYSLVKEWPIEVMHRKFFFIFGFKGHLYGEFWYQLIKIREKTKHLSLRIHTRRSKQLWQ